jgi:hypothetical protein
MKLTQWGFLVILNFIIISFSVKYGFGKAGVQALVPLYVTISMAILAIIFAIAAINKEMLKRELTSIKTIALASIICIFAGFMSIYPAYFNDDAWIPTSVNIFFISTIALTIVILEMGFSVYDYLKN